MEPWNLKDLDHFKIIVWLILENTILSWQFSFWYDPTVGTLDISGIAVPLVFNLASPQQPELQTLISGGPSSIVWPLCVFWSPSIFVDPGGPLLISCNYFYNRNHCFHCIHLNHFIHCSFSFNVAFPHNLSHLLFVTSALPVFHNRSLFQDTNIEEL